MKKKENKDNYKQKTNYLAKYSGLAFEMLGIIVLGAFAGKKLDDRRGGEFPIYTVVLSLLAVFAALYLVIKGLINNGTKS